MTTSVFDQVDEVAHVRIAQACDLVVIAPATADLIARMAMGRADDLLTSTLLMTTAPIVISPAMHTEMWRHPATQENVKTLRTRGIRVLEPAVGRLTGKDSGPGRLPDPRSIALVCEALLCRDDPSQDLAGVRVTVSAGGTREPIDPVRYLGNRSSGRQGWAIAAAAIARGAIVTVVAANVDAPDPVGAEVVRVESAGELHSAVLEHTKNADVVIMAAAVADFRPGDVATSKIKKSGADEGLRLELVRTTDVLADLGAHRSEHRPVLVGFAAETEPDEENLVSLAQGKLASKQVDLVVANEVGSGLGFESRENRVVIVSEAAVVGRTERTSKLGVANVVLDAVSSLL